LFFETIRELKAEKTILLIAHKLHDYSGLDSVYELSGGNLHKLS
jgi:ABC-type transport system involved in cytochrome bd biosynthesis fused ATPase/permease subunit